MGGMLLPLALFLALAPAGGDPVVEVRADLGQNGWPQQVRAYEPALTHANTLGEPVASDLKFEKAAGKKPTIMVFPADWDGDGTDELVTVRVQQVKDVLDLRLRVYRPPLTLDGNTGKPLASSSKLTLGSPLGEGRIVLMGAADVAGNDKDRPFAIREWSGGPQSLEVLGFPKKVDKPMKEAVASDASFGDASSDANRAACGADVDGDGRDEIVVIRAAPGGVDRLLVFRPPEGLLGETGDPIRSDLDITPGDGGQNVGIGRIDVEGDGQDELALRRLHPLTGQRLEIVRFPAEEGGEISAPLFTVPDLQPMGAAHAEVAVFGLRGYHAVVPPPPADLSGTYTAAMSHQADGGAEVMPPLGDLIAPQVGGGAFAINLPTFFPLVGAYSQAQAQIDFGTGLNKLKVVSTGDLYWLAFGVASVKVQGGKVKIQGTYSGSKVPPSGPTQAITGGSYSFTRK